ncbi:MAG: hypothetical protein AB7G37_12195 [Solirubrobacteraceae bacterium]
MSSTTAATAGQLFRVVQVEAAGTVALEDGRWMTRGHANRPEAVVLIESTERPRRRFLRPRRVDPTAGTPVTATRISVIDADPLDVPDPARWLDQVAPAAALREALATIRRLVDLHAAAAEDPFPRPFLPEDLIRAAVGFGTGEAVSSGRWAAERPITVPAERPVAVRRSGQAMGPDERLADLLAGRDAVLAAERLWLRARADLHIGHEREAALQLRVALEAAIAELEPWRAAPGIDTALDELRGTRRDVAEVAGAAARGGLDPDQVAYVEQTVARLGRALAARTRGRHAGDRG